MKVNRWLPLLLLFGYIGLVLRIPYVIALAATLLVVLSVSYWWRNHSLDGIEYQRRFRYTRAFPGERYPVRIEIENRKILPISWLRVEDPWPKAVGPEDEEILAPSHVQDQGFLTHALSLRWYERIKRSYMLLFRKRGHYRLGPPRLESGDLFGIYEKLGVSTSTDNLTVFPLLAPLSELELPPEKPFGESRSRRRLFEDPNRPMGVREYHPEDGFRRMHWPATARTGQLQVRVFEPTSAQVMVLCLNVSTYHRYWEGVYPALLERLLSVAATLVDAGIQHGYRVGLISNGCLSNSDQPFQIPPGRTPRQLGHILQALAGVTPVVVAPFERFLIRELPKVPYGSTLVVLSAITPPELIETLVSLRKHERQITLFSLAERTPGDIPGIRVIHLPFIEPDDGRPNRST
jgi:uncharacterized protein (DUF58 family)